jgi:hypothetical protein
MTRSNLHIKLSNGNLIHCVCDSSSAPEQGYFVENLLYPLLKLNNSEKEVAFLTDLCAMYEDRANATYRYIINLQTKAVHFFAENYDYGKDKFYLGDNLTERLLDYIDSTEALRELFTQFHIKPKDQ